MKSFRFNKKEPVIRGYKEDVFPKKKVNWDRIIYLFIFFIVMGSLGLYVIRRNFFASSFGEVISDKFEVNFSDDVKVVKYFVNENQLVAVGDTLLVVRPQVSPVDSLGLAKRERSLNKEWIEKEKLTTEKNIRLKHLEKNRLKGVEQRENKSYKTKLDEVYLGLENASVIKLSEERLLSLKSEILSLDEEIRYLKNYQHRLRNMEKELETYAPQVVIVPENIPYVSPVAGIVSQIFSKKDEITYRKDVVMDLLSFEDVHVMAYLPQEIIEYFNVSDTVGVKFGNGMKSLGIIKNIYFNTAELPGEFRTTYQNSVRTVLARIEPLNSDFGQDWKPFFKMAVTIYRPKIFEELWLNIRLRNEEKNKKYS